MFISIEGGDGSGKSTQAAKLVEWLNGQGRRSRYVREPGGTPVGEELRRILKSAGDISPRAELLMFEAARAELVQKVVRPALASGEVVVADRFSDSSIAYQSYGRGLPSGSVRALNAFATAGLEPDLSILLDLPFEVASRRAEKRDLETTGSRSATAGPAAERRFEMEDSDFHRRVLDGYREISRAEPNRWVTVDASRTVEEVASDIWTIVVARLLQKGW